LSAAHLADAIRDAARAIDAPALAGALGEALQRAPRIAAARDARALHDALLFAIAHPPDAACRTAAETALAALATRLEGAERLASRLQNSGLAGTAVVSEFSLPVVRALAAGEGARLAHDSADADFTLTQLFVREALLPPERERLEREQHSLDRWLARHAPPQRRLALLLAWVAASTRDERMQELLFAALRVFVRWDLTGSSWSLTRARGLARPVHYAVDRPKSVRLDDWVAKPLPRAAKLSRDEAAHLLATARGVLACLLREVDTVTYGSPDGVTLFRLERGVDIALFGMRPGYRLALESYFGYMAFRNGVPAAYGGAWMFGHRCKIGINIFPFMRGGESALLLAQLVRTYARHYGPDVFFVEPYQIGQGNPDGIRSGAFWFYYRLGFRPVQEPLAALAADAHARLQAGERTPVAVLRKLAGADLRWVVPGGRTAPLPDPYAVNRALTRWIDRHYAGNRIAAVQASRTTIRRLFGRALPEVNAEYGPLLAMLEGASQWPARDRAALARMLTAKLEGDERDYALGLVRHRRLLAALAAW
jgi:hypothetical protein